MTTMSARERPIWSLSVSEMSPPRIQRSIFDTDPYPMMSQPRGKLSSRNRIAKVLFTDNRKDLDSFRSFEERQRIGDRPGRPGASVPGNQHTFGKAGK